MTEARVLAVDDEKSMRDLLAIILKKEGYRADVARNRQEVEGFLAANHYQLVISDVKMPGFSGIEVLRMVRENSPETRVILVTAYASTETAIEAMKLGAFDYITKPFQVDEMKRLVRAAMQRERETVLPREVKTEVATDYIVGDSRGIIEICKTIGRVANRKITVVITGESGTGKELIARAIHYNSERKSKPFITVNCGALTDTLLESELFGHVKGSFTGAVGDKKGLFEAANGGTFFLDEISETSKTFQVKLLRVLQEEKVKRVGDTADVPVDARIIAATNQDLARLIREGAFREDLYYRLNVISIRVPPLRERREDIPRLVDYFLKKYHRGHGDPVRLTQDALDLLMRYRWPGNVRELENVIERAMAMESGEAVTSDSLPPILSGGEAAGDVGQSAAEFPPEGVNLEEILDRIEQSYVRKALEKARGNRQEAARLLGLTMRSFRYRLAKIKQE
jgi:two-component system response regulator PilR (NtrC family)